MATSYVISIRECENTNRNNSNKNSDDNNCNYKYNNNINNSDNNCNYNYNINDNYNDSNMIGSDWGRPGLFHTPPNTHPTCITLMTRT